VINFDPPEDRDAYVHRVGRTGRAGRDGIGITFHSAAERGKIAGLADELGIEHRVAPAARIAAPAHARASAPRRALNKPPRPGAGTPGGARRANNRRRQRQA
jgi:superfamily II DNA/RNA helicase